MCENYLQIYRVVPQEGHVSGERPIVLQLSDHYQLLRLLDNTIVVAKTSKRNIQHHSTFKCLKTLLDQFAYHKSRAFVDELRDRITNFSDHNVGAKNCFTVVKARRVLYLYKAEQFPFAYQTTRNAYKIHYLKPANGDLLVQFYGIYQTEKVVRSLLYPMNCSIRPFSDQLLRTSHNFLAYEQFAAIYQEIQSSYLVCIKQHDKFYKLTPQQHDEKVQTSISLQDSNSSLDISEIENSLQNGHIFVFFHGQDSVNISQVNFQHLYLFAPNIRTLTGNECGLDSIYLRNCQHLARIDIHKNHIATMDLSGYMELAEADLSENQLVYLGINDCPLLRCLRCKGNRMQSVQLIQVPELRILDLSDNQIADLDTADLKLLEILYVQQNQLAKLDLTRNSHLQELNANTNRLESLSIEGCADLEQLFAQDNRLTELLCTGCAGLQVLWAYRNRLERLEVEQCMGLAILWVQENPGLTSINVMNCIVLNEILVDDEDALIY